MSVQDPKTQGDAYAGLTPARKAYVENLSIVLSHRTMILWIAAVVTIATAVYAFGFMPNWYRSSTVILPARRSGGALDNVTSSIASSLKDIGIAKLKGGEEGYTPLSIMKSRELAEHLIRKYDLIKVYDDKNIEEALEDFGKNLDGEVGEDGNFIISFEDTSRQRAADIANDVVAEINAINSRMSKDEAAHNVTASQMRYEQNARDLDSAETALGAFQRKYGVYSMPEQAKAQLTALADLEQQKYVAQIQLQNAEQLYGSNSSEVTVYRNTLQQLTSALAQMQSGLDAKASSFVPTSVMPDVALQYLRLMREVEIQSKLKAFLLPAYEQAKMDQQRNLYGFVTLDRAVPAIKKAKPHRSTLLLGAIIGSIALSSLVVILSAKYKRQREAFRADRAALGL